MIYEQNPQERTPTMKTLNVTHVAFSVIAPGEKERWDNTKPVWREIGQVVPYGIDGGFKIILNEDEFYFRIVCLPRRGRRRARH